MTNLAAGSLPLSRSTGGFTLLESFPVIESADGEWLTVEQVAERLGLAAATVRSLVASGDLPADFVVPSPRPKLRRRIARIRPDDVEDFVARCPGHAWRPCPPVLAASKQHQPLTSTASPATGGH